MIVTYSTTFIHNILLIFQQLLIRFHLNFSTLIRTDQQLTLDAPASSSSTSCKYDSKSEELMIKLSKASKCYLIKQFKVMNDLTVPATIYTGHWIIFLNDLK